jgi:hypothetical protein
VNISKQSIIDFLLFYGFVIAIIVIYFRVDRQWGIYITLGGIFVLTITYFPIVYKSANRLKYQKIISILKSQDIIREEAVIKIMKEDPLKIHKYLFDLTNIYKKGPLVVLVKRFYIYINKEIVNDVIQILENFQDEKYDKSIDLVKVILQKYKFETRAEAEALISKIRENDLVKSKENKPVKDSSSSPSLI